MLSVFRTLGITKLNRLNNIINRIIQKENSHLNYENYDYKYGMIKSDKY